MSITLNNILVTNVSLSMPRCGLWSADLEIAITNPSNGQPITNIPTVGQKVTLSIRSDAVNPTPAFVWSGVAITSIPGIIGRQQMRIVGGVSGGFVKTIAAQQFAGPSVNTVLSAMLSSGGETLNSTLSQSSLLSRRLPSWQIFADRTLAQNLTALTNQLGCSWRIDPASGGLTLQVDVFNTTATLPTNAVIQHIDPDGDISYWSPNLDALPLPGQLNANGNDINEVMIFADATHTYVELFAQQASQLQQNSSIQIDLSGVYPGTVSAQNSNSTLSITPDDPSIAGANGLQNVRIRGGASATWTVKGGARVDVVFENGDPSLPCVIAIDGWLAGDFLTTLAYGDPVVAQFVALANLCNENFSAIKTFLNSEITLATGVGPTSAGSLVPLSLPSADVSAKRIKSD